MFLHAAAKLQRHHDNLFHILLGKDAIGIKQLGKAGDHLPDRDHVTLVQIGAKPEVLVAGITEGSFSHLPQEL